MRSFAASLPTHATRPASRARAAAWLAVLLLALLQPLFAQAPRVLAPTGGRPVMANRPPIPSERFLYPWKTHITVTIFWVGEQPTDRNPTPNCKSSWDSHWAVNFGGYDDPNPANRVANHSTGEFRPKAFLPKLNPFYVALPYNDVLNHREHKPEASRVIPWFHRVRPPPGKTVLKGRWLQIYNGSRSCYAQWEDCGPWVTDDWEYVFGDKPPRNRQNKSAGLDISPAVRDYLGLRSGQKVHWRFVEDSQVPYGPWKKYGLNAPPTPNTAAYWNQRKARPGQAPLNPSADADLESQRRYLEYLRKLRDEDFQKKPLP